jgi:hypothetical protein
MVFGKVTGKDPLSLGDNETVAEDMGFSKPQTNALQQVAHDHWRPVIYCHAAKAASNLVGRCEKLDSRWRLKQCSSISSAVSTICSRIPAGRYRRSGIRDAGWVARARRRDMHQADRLFLAAAAGTGNAGDRDRQSRGGIAQRAVAPWRAPPLRETAPCWRTAPPARPACPAWPCRNK